MNMTTMSDSLQAVTHCRKALAWSYVEGYYIEERLRDLFNHVQSQLEQYTDHLQEMLGDSSNLTDAGCPTADVNAYLGDVKRYTGVIQSFLTKICSAMRDGFAY